MRAATVDGSSLTGRLESPTWRVGEGTGVAQRGPRLLDRVRENLRLRHYSRRTERAYVAWIRRYILFLRAQHERDLRGGPEKLDDGHSLSPMGLTDMNPKHSRFGLTSRCSGPGARDARVRADRER